MSLPFLSGRLFEAVTTFVAALALVVLPVLADYPARAGEIAPPAISILGVGNVNARPDMATVSTGVVSEAKTAGEALSANTTAMTSIVAWLKENGIEDRDIQTSGFAVQPRYTYPAQQTNGERRPPRIVGYTVSNQVTIRVRDLEKLGDILDQVVSEGSNQINGVSFTFSEPEKLLDMARANAMADAIRKAKIYTDAAGIGIGRITSISEIDRNRPQPQYDMARAGVVMSEAPPVPMEAGERTLSVQINVTWELDQ
jgi:uncharacterized protein